MMRHSDLTDEEVTQKIKSGEIVIAGNASLKIYGRLNCKSGKRMLRKNRVFFKSKQQAVQLGFRPCGHCLTQDYMAAKQRQISLS
ncbi:MAG: Ada metal-binding domain-containing protein [Cyclobacteriaceae bacterium]